MKRRALSLTEIILSIFVLTGIILLIVNLFHAGLRYQARAEQRSIASMLLDRTLDEVRAWARIPANFDSNWAAYNGVSRVDADLPNFRVEIDAAPDTLVLDSPCAPLEQPYGALGKRLVRAVVPVRVTVRWGGQSLAAVTTIGEPLRTLRAVNPIVITRTAGPGDPVPPDGVVTFEARAYDDNGAELENGMFVWDVQSVTGSATLITAGMPRDGSRIQVEHRYRLGNGASVYRPGLVRVRAHLLYHGRETTEETPVVLQ